MNRTTCSATPTAVYVQASMTRAISANLKSQAAHPSHIRKKFTTLCPGNRKAANSPGEGQHRRGYSKTHHVRQRIELYSKIRVRTQQPRKTPVQRIKQNREANRLSRPVKIRSCSHQRRHNRKVTAKQIRRRKQCRHEKHSSPEPGILEAPLSKRDLVLFRIAHGYDRFPVAVRFASVSAALTASNLSAMRFAGHRASTLAPPFTFSPTFTKISASFGTHTSTRDPNRTSPMRSPRATFSPAFFQETTLRAINPAICLNTISPASVESVNTFCSFSTEARSRIAARNFPGRYSSFVMVPAAGARFTCTFQTARKMLTRFPGLPAFSSSMTTTTRPSPGDTTAPGSVGIMRSGSRKKEKTNAASSTRTAAATYQCSKKLTTPSARGGT